MKLAVYWDCSLTALKSSSKWFSNIVIKLYIYNRIYSEKENEKTSQTNFYNPISSNANIAILKTIIYKIKQINYVNFIQN